MLQSHRTFSVNTRFAGFPEILAKWDTRQGLTFGRRAIPEPMGAWRAHWTWTEVTRCLG